VSNLFVPSRKSAAIRITSLLAVLSALSLTGCASMINGSKQSIKIETVDAATGAHKPAICHISKRGLSISGKSTDTFEVGRGDEHIYVMCEDGNSTGRLRQESDFAQRYLFLDIATDLCLVSCFVDGYNRAWYEYPSPMVVEMKTAP
jgi:hypothetical protein